MSKTKTDWLGQEYGPDDLVLYAAMSGRSCNMVLGRVVRFGPRSVTVAPVKGARRQHGGRTRYIDTRTGKGIDPWAASRKHIKRESGRENTETGEFISYDDLHALSLPWREEEARYPRAPDGPWKYVPAVFHDYVKTSEPQVTLTVLKNVTKWTGEVPE